MPIPTDKEVMDHVKKTMERLGWTNKKKAKRKKGGENK
jgi:hypothetical protein